MKKLIIINGTMGIGKSVVCKQLNKVLKNSVWLDGDWCWMMNSFIVNEENKKMVEDNIIHLLRNFLQNQGFDYILFSWVIHKEFIYDIILKGLQRLEFDLFKITLMCSEQVLRERLESGDGSKADIQRSINYLHLYHSHHSIKVNTDGLSVSETVQEILSIITRN